MGFIEIQKESNVWPESTAVDLLINAQVDRSEIQMLCKLVEGLGHLGVVTTINKESGEVIIQTTRHCWPELKKIIENMPLNIKYL